MKYQIHLENFTGPLDLLLFFIRRDEIDIMDIPISQITEDYLAYLETLQFLNVGIAGEFIMIASILMRIKARMLLPQLSVDDDGEIVDPRKELVQRLLEYQKYKQLAEKLNEMMTSQNLKFPRPANRDYQDLEEDPSSYIQDISLFELAHLFKKLIEKIPPVVSYDLAREQIKVRERMEFLMAQFVNKKQLKFSELFSECSSKYQLIVTFIAILELIRDGELRVTQRSFFSDFKLECVSSESVSNINIMSKTMGEA